MKANNKVTLLDVKQALRDGRFRASLPPSLADGLVKYLQNPGCGCNTAFYRDIMTFCATQLQEYFPGKEVAAPGDDVANLADNNWTVFSCPVGEIEKRLKALPPGRKQIAVARFEDQATVIINELDLTVL